MEMLSTVAKTSEKTVAFKLVALDKSSARWELQSALMRELTPDLVRLSASEYQFEASVQGAAELGMLIEMLDTACTLALPLTEDCKRQSKGAEEPEQKKAPADAPPTYAAIPVLPEVVCALAFKAKLNGECIDALLNAINGCLAWQVEAYVKQRKPANERFEKRMLAYIRSWLTSNKFEWLSMKKAREQLRERLRPQADALLHQLGCREEVARFLNFLGLLKEVDDFLDFDEAAMDSKAVDEYVKSVENSKVIHLPASDETWFIHGKFAMRMASGGKVQWRAEDGIDVAVLCGDEFPVNAQAAVHRILGYISSDAMVFSRRQNMIEAVLPSPESHPNFRITFVRGHGSSMEGALLSYSHFALRCGLAFRNGSLKVRATAACMLELLALKTVVSSPFAAFSLSTSRDHTGPQNAKELAQGRGDGATRGPAGNLLWLIKNGFELCVPGPFGASKKLSDLERLSNSEEFERTPLWVMLEADADIDTQSVTHVVRSVIERHRVMPVHARHVPTFDIVPTVYLKHGIQQQFPSPEDSRWLGALLKDVVEEKSPVDSSDAHSDGHALLDQVQLMVSSGEIEKVESISVRLLAKKAYARCAELPECVYLTEDLAFRKYGMSLFEFASFLITTKQKYAAKEPDAAIHFVRDSDRNWNPDRKRGREILAEASSSSSSSSSSASSKMQKRPDDEDVVCE